MSDELHECMGYDEVALRLIGIIERLLDENAALRGKAVASITVPKVTYGPNDINRPWVVDTTPTVKMEVDA